MNKNCNSPVSKVSKIITVIGFVVTLGLFVATFPVAYHHYLVKGYPCNYIIATLFTVIFAAIATVGTGAVLNAAARLFCEQPVRLATGIILLAEAAVVIAGMCMNSAPAIMAILFMVAGGMAIIWGLVLMLSCFWRDPHTIAHDSALP